LRVELAVVEALPERREIQVVVVVAALAVQWRDF
jgi:hypothetical protein